MNLSAFLADHVKPAEETEFVVSARITGEDGKPVKWRLKAIGADEDALLRRDCTRTVPVTGGRKGQTRTDFNFHRYLAMLAAACTVFPNLNDGALQQSWGAKNADDLLCRMLLPGELSALQEKANELCAFDTMQDLVDEAKN